VGLTKAQCDEIDKFYCPACSKIHGPTTCSRFCSQLNFLFFIHDIYFVCFSDFDQSKLRRSGRQKVVPNYVDLNRGAVALENKFVGILEARKKMFTPENFRRLSGSQLTMEYVKETGLREPVIIETSGGTGLRVPKQPFTVDSVLEILGTPSPPRSLFSRARLFMIPSFLLRR